MSEADGPRVSVIVPTRDRRALLERKLRALEEDHSGLFEVVVVADACQDDTEAFLSAYRPSYALAWLRGPGRHAATARNLGAGSARGDVLLFSDDDVIAPPGWVEENLRLHAEPGRVGLSRQTLPSHLTTGDVLRAVHGWWNLNGRSTSMRADAFRAVGGYDPDFSTYGGEDPDLGYRLWRQGASFHLLDQVEVEHHDDGYLASLDAKGRSAGRAHVRVWRKHRDHRVALALGVHPAVLALKGLVMHRSWTRWLRHHRYRWEVAYLEGARLAVRGGA